MSKWLLASVGGITLLILAGIGLGAMITMNKARAPNTDVSDHASSLINTDRLNSLDQLSASLINTSRLDDSLTPPTNKWYSGMVLASEPQPGFSMPNSILPRTDSFELGLPSITSNTEGIYGPHTNGIQLAASAAKSYKLTRYDELTLTLTYYDAPNQPLFDVTFAAGSPYAFVSAKRDVDVTLRGGTLHEQRDGLTTFQTGESWYGAKTSNGETGQSISLTKGDDLTMFGVNRQSDIPQLAKLAMNTIQSGEVTYEVTDSKVKTTLLYKTKDNKPTVLVRMPHQKDNRTEASAVTYRSLYGNVDGYRTNTIEYSQPVQSLEWSLPLGKLSSANKDELKAQLKIDIENSKLDKNDTYFGGKQLQRLAQLVITADAIGDTQQRDVALSKLRPGLAAWFDDNDDRSFYYDKTAKTIVGREASFGSDKQLNDHHFHYGYFIYAASTVAKFDDTFLKKYKDDINLLVADIANYKLSEALPVRRNFDPYAGHSWASGFANYKDGNNQESSSEAVNAWTAVGLWGDVTNNDTLSGESAWLLANEASTVQTYWLATPPKESYLNKFSSPLVSINWGGKREYKTFFSDEANAKLAIQLLPLNPTMKSYIAKLPAPMYEGADTKKQYGDYILMARHQQDAYALSKKHPDTLIDDGNSKTYMMAYALSVQSR